SPETSFIHLLCAMCTDIFFLMDDSGSIINEEFSDMQKFIIEFLHTFRIGPDHVRMGLVKYSNSPSLEFDLTQHSDAKTMEKVVKDIIHKGGGTNTGKALSSMKGHFENAKKSRGYKVSEYLIVITDGKSQDKVKIPAEELRTQDVIIYAIGVINFLYSGRLHFMAHIIEIIRGEDREEDHKLFQKHRLDVYTYSIFLYRTHKASTFTFSEVHSLKCTWKTTLTSICFSSTACKDTQGDIFFLTDSSQSISEEGFQKMKDFTKSFISKSSIGQDKVHIGVMQYSTNTRLEFDLTTHYNLEGMLNTIDDMTPIKTRTHTGRAITEVSQYFDAARGRRPGVKQWLVVMTDGKSRDSVKEPAQALRAKGVVIYAIGVDKANSSKLSDISGPSSQRFFIENTFDGFKELGTKLALKFCEKGKRGCFNPSKKVRILRKKLEF
uniref:VWFA domain-containing protein n=1 Tax=Pundamilia nyererei TaxID=303518 RepID=A0A3B4GBL6_9CICH